MAQIRMKAVIPKNVNPKALLAELTKEMKGIQKDVAKDFDGTVRTWKDKPKFDQPFESSDRRIRFEVSTSDKIYGYVSGGTRPHLIRPKHAKVLHFQGTYTAKTMPGTLSSRAGGASGDDVFAKAVHHPGTKPRDFDGQMVKKWKGPFPKRIHSATGRAAKRSGHGI